MSPGRAIRLTSCLNEKYADVFARPEVSAPRIIFLAKVMELVETHLDKIKNKALGHYALTKYAILASVKRLLASDPVGLKLCQSPDIAFDGERLSCALKLIDDLLTSIIIDLNHELDQGAMKDYKSDLKSRKLVEALISELLRSYEKDKARGKADAINVRLEACGIKGQ